MASWARGNGPVQAIGTIAISSNGDDYGNETQRLRMILPLLAHEFWKQLATRQSWGAPATSGVKRNLIVTGPGTRCSEENPSVTKESAGSQPECLSEVGEIIRIQNRSSSSGSAVIWPFRNVSLPGRLFRDTSSIST
ncbi:hypothetical protein NPIL_381761 [Nephila pilipes]|uniref:Uncharacterized protein n=1 Tax=Nephila pilipes TaxID=299642 RepID=A0A8X6T9P0_NEPPI|nr:hypothetical protein NPIL_381761 [Nephila pilipes]